MSSDEVKAIAGGISAVLTAFARYIHTWRRKVTPFALVGFLLHGALAQGQVWIGSGGADWNTATNWNPSLIPNSTNAIADFTTRNITNNASVFVSSDITVNQLLFSDTGFNATSTSQWILDTSNGSTLTLGGTSPVIDVQLGNNNGNALIDDLRVAVASGVTVTKIGPGKLTFDNGSLSDFLGNLVVEQGTVAAGRLNNTNLDNFLPKGTITLAGTGNGSLQANSEKNLSINHDFILDAGGTATFTFASPGNDRNDVNGEISGEGGLFLTHTGTAANSEQVRFTTPNTYTGDTTIGDGITLDILNTSSVLMDINSMGDSTEFLGTGTGVLNLDALVTLDVADVTENGTWDLFDLVNLTVTFQDDFALELAGGTLFLESTPGIYTAGDDWTFTQATGALVFSGASVPEPAGIAIWSLLGMALVGFEIVRRQRKQLNRWSGLRDNTPAAPSV